MTPSNGVVNAADYTAEIAPGGIIAVFGTSLAPRSAQAARAPLPSTLEGVSVEVSDGARTVLAPLFFVSPGQVNAQMPFEMSGSSVRVRVRTAAGAGQPVTVPLQGRSPRLFTRTLDGKGEPVLLHADYTVVSEQSPARAGEVLILYLTGLGEVTPALESGRGAGDGGAGGPLNRVSGDVVVLLAGVPAVTLFAGLAPSFVGLYQLNIQLPENLAPGRLDIEVVSGGRRSQQNVRVAVASAWVAAGGGTLGAAGGSVEAGPVRIEAGPGVVASAAVIQVFRAGSGGVGAPESYLLAGMPDATGAPLSLTLQAPPGDAAGDEESFVAVRVSDGAETPPRLLRARRSGDALTVTVPAYDSLAATEDVGKFKGAAKSSPYWMVYALQGFRNVPSSSGKFVVFYKSVVGWEKARRLADALEGAYTVLGQKLGLDWGRRKPENWPVLAFVYPFEKSRLSGMSPDQWGLAGESFTSVQNQDLHFNALFMETEEQMRLMSLTAAHELFHILQNLYDPRTSMQMKWGSDTPWLWFEEAASTWLERLVAPDPASYVPTTLKPDPLRPESSSDNYAFLTSGLASPNTREHGYGAAMFLQHLSSKYPERVVGDILKQMAVPAKVGTGYWPQHLPLDAIRSVLTRDLASEWKEFCRSYVAGTVYGRPGGRPFPAPDLLFGMLRESHVFTSSQLSRTWQWKAPDLSAAGFSLAFQNSSFPDGTTLRLSVQPDTSELIVYKFKRQGENYDWVQVAAGVREYEYRNAEQLKKNGESLFVFVVNGRNVYPYNGTAEMRFTADASPGVLGWLSRTDTATFRIRGEFRCTQMKTGAEERCFQFMGFIWAGNTSQAPLVWSGTNFSARGVVNDVVFGGERREGPAKVDIQGQVSADGKTLRTARFQFDHAGVQADMSFQNVPLYLGATTECSNCSASYAVPAAQFPAAVTNLKYCSMSNGQPYHCLKSVDLSGRVTPFEIVVHRP